MSVKTAVVYPDNVVDIDSFHMGVLDKPKSDYINAFSQISRGAYLVRCMHTMSETMTTRLGEVRLDKDTYTWWLGNKQVGLVYLCQRMPKLKEYFVTRTYALIEYRLDEIEKGVYSNRDTDFMNNQIGNLRRELDQVNEIDSL